MRRCTCGYVHHPGRARATWRLLAERIVRAVTEGA